MRLIFDTDIQCDFGVGHQSGKHIAEPTVERVGIDNQRNTRRSAGCAASRGVADAERSERFAFKQGHLFGIAQQRLAGHRHPAGRPAFDQDLPEPLFQLAYALTDRRRRNVEPARGGVKATVANDGGEARQLGMIDFHD